MFTFHIGLSPFLFELLKITVEKSTLIFNTYFAEKISVAVPTVIFHFGKYVSLERQLFSAKKYVLKKQQLFLLGWKQKSRSTVREVKQLLSVLSMQKQAVFLSMFQSIAQPFLQCQ